MPTSKELLDARKRIDRQLEGLLTDQRLQEILDEALQIKKKGWADFSCKKCGARQRQQAEIMDTVGVTRVMDIMLNQAKGRPSEEKPDAGVSVLYRVDLGED